MCNHRVQQDGDAQMLVPPPEPSDGELNASEAHADRISRSAPAKGARAAPFGLRSFCRRTGGQEASG